MEKAELIISVQTMGVPAALNQLKRVEAQAARTVRQMKQVCGVSSECLGRIADLTVTLPENLGRAWPPAPGAGPGGDNPWDWNPEEVFSGLSDRLAQDWRQSLDSLEQGGRDMFSDLEDGLEHGFQDMTGSLTDGFQDMLRELSSGLENLLDMGLGGLWDELTHGLEGLLDLDMEEMFGDLGQWLEGLLDLDLEGLVGDFSGWLEDLTGLDLSSLLGDLSDWLGSLLDLDLGDLFQGLVDGLGSILDLEGLWDSVTDGLGDIVDLEGLVQGIGDGLGDLFDGIFGGGLSPEEARQRIENAYAAAERAAVRIEQSLTAQIPISTMHLHTIDQAMAEIRRLGARAGYSTEQMEAMGARLREMVEAVKQTGGAIVASGHEMDELRRIMNWGNDQVGREYQGLADSLDSLGRAFSRVSAPGQGADSSPGSDQTGGYLTPAEMHQGGRVGPLTAWSMLSAHGGMYLGRLRPGEIPIVAQQGEFVLSRGDVSRLGGASAVEQLRQEGRGRPVVLNVDMTIEAGGADSEEIAEAVQNRINELARYGVDTSTTRHGTVNI